MDRIPVAQVGIQWWDQSGIELKGSRENVTEAAVDAAAEEDGREK